MDFFLIKPDAYQKKLRDVILEEIKKYYTVTEIFTVLLSVENLKTIYPFPVAFHLARWYGFCDRALEVIIVDGDDISESKSHKLKDLLRKTYDWKHRLNAIPGVRIGSLLHSPDERDRDVQLGTLRSATFEDLNASSNFFLIQPDAHTLDE